MAFGIGQRELDSGDVDLARIALLNDYLDMQQDNDYLIEQERRRE